jgi:hypothetical protein
MRIYDLSIAELKRSLKLHPVSFLIMFFVFLGFEVAGKVFFPIHQGMTMEDATAQSFVSIGGVYLEFAIAFLILNFILISRLRRDGLVLKTVSSVGAFIKALLVSVMTVLFLLTIAVSVFGAAYGIDELDKMAIEQQMKLTSLVAGAAMGLMVLSLSHFIITFQRYILNAIGKTNMGCEGFVIHGFKLPFWTFLMLVKHWKVCLSSFLVMLLLFLESPSMYQNYYIVYALASSLKTWLFMLLLYTVTASVPLREKTGGAHG